MLKKLFWSILYWLLIAIGFLIAGPTLICMGLTYLGSFLIDKVEDLIITVDCKRVED